MPTPGWLVRREGATMAHAMLTDDQRRDNLSRQLRVARTELLDAQCDEARDAARRRIDSLLDQWPETD